MFQPFVKSSDRSKDYTALADCLSRLLEGETDVCAALSNASALLNWFLEDVNWVGFYLWKEKEGLLVLGPFQGLPACVRIPAEKGVCGKAYRDAETQLIPDVLEFPGHIACDAASRSELVVPVRRNGSVAALLDIDSPTPGRFDGIDAAGMEACAAVLEGLQDLNWDA